MAIAFALGTRLDSGSSEAAPSIVVRPTSFTALPAVPTTSDERSVADRRDGVSGEEASTRDNRPLPEPPPLPALALLPALLAAAKDAWPCVSAGRIAPEDDALTARAAGADGSAAIAAQEAGPLLSAGTVRVATAAAAADAVSPWAEALLFGRTHAVAAASLVSGGASAGRTIGDPDPEPVAMELLLKTETEFEAAAEPAEPDEGLRQTVASLPPSG